MSLLLVGSVGLDTVEAPTGRVEEVLGGSAVYAAVAAALFTEPLLVGVVGPDFPDKHRRFLEKRGVKLEGLAVAGEPTFRWTGRYTGAMEQAETLECRLGALEGSSPEVPREWRATPYVFLANCHPKTQESLLDQLSAPVVVLADTMNKWIVENPKELEELLAKVPALVVNDAEARMITGETTLLAAGRELSRRGPRTVVIKKGEHGAMLLSGSEVAFVPAYPLERIIDPTGAGDSFAGAMLGYLAALGRAPEGADWRRAVACGSAVASFTVEDFSLGRLGKVKREEADERVAALENMTRF